MKIEKINNLWVPSNDNQIVQWRKEGSPYMQDRCLNRFLKYCDNKNIQFKTVLDIGAWCGTWTQKLFFVMNQIKLILLV